MRRKDRVESLKPKRTWIFQKTSTKSVAVCKQLGMESVHRQRTHIYLLARYFATPVIENVLTFFLLSSADFSALSIVEMLRRRLLYWIIAKG